jgi:hypothetical protein
LIRTFREYLDGFTTARLGLENRFVVATRNRHVSAEERHSRDLRLSKTQILTQSQRGEAGNDQVGFGQRFHRDQGVGDDDT